MMDKNYIKGLKDLAFKIYELRHEVDEENENIAIEAFLRGVEFMIECIEDEGENEGA